MTTRPPSLTDQLELVLADLGYTGETQKGRRRLMRLLAETNPGFHETERLRASLAEAREDRRRLEHRYYELRYQVERVIEGVTNREAIRILEEAVRDDRTAVDQDWVS